MSQRGITLCALARVNAKVKETLLGADGGHVVLEAASADHDRGEIQPSRWARLVVDGEPEVFGLEKLHAQQPAQKTARGKRS